MDEKRLVYGEDTYVPMVYEEPTYSDTATAADVREGATVHINGKEVTGELPDVEQATPTISFDSGTITATAEQAAGYVDEGVKSATMELTPIVHAAPTVTLSGKTITATVDYGEGWSTEETKVTTIEQAVQTMPAPEIIVQDSGVINVNVPALHGYYAQNSNGYVKYQDVVSVPTPSIAFDAQSGEVTAENTQGRGYTKGGTASSVLSLPVASLAAPSIAIDGPNITATVEQGAGYIGGGVASASAVVPTVPLSTPTISIDGPNVTATVAQEAGYVGGGTTSAFAQVTTVELAEPNISIKYSLGYVNVGINQAEGYVLSSAFNKSIAFTKTQLEPISMASEWINGGAALKINASVSVISSYYSAKSRTATLQLLGKETEQTVIPLSTAQQHMFSNTYLGSGITVEAIPSEYIIPSGTVEITDNGAYDVRAYESASVNVVPWDAIAAANLSGFAYGKSAVLIREQKFAACTGITGASFPKAERIGKYAFNDCNLSLGVSFPLVRTINSAAFMNCGGLSSVYFPEVDTNVEMWAFSGCTNLSYVKFDKVSGFGSSAFFKCVTLTEVHLENVTSVPPYFSSNAFNSTPISNYSAVAGKYGSIYVPASLYDAFTTANNWSYFSSRMVSV